MTVDATRNRHDRLMLLSIRPRHVVHIMSGLKTVELRRSRPGILPGQPVAIYSTTPQAAVVALCRVSHVESAPPATLWGRVGGQSGVRRSDFNDYFTGSKIAVALHLTDVEALEEPVSLADLRLRGPFQPPQTWHFLDRERVRSLFGEHPAAAQLSTALEAAM
ncbi:hypothetical protein [Sanguibacter suarezii]|uniref:hypothetical protein n=1 Tax=Sanguibacter suarezii TaxID=60921 RepID=UPI0012F70F1B|nr:hypothetical protein [Sanguibacter suarezii]